MMLCRDDHHKTASPRRSLPALFVRPGQRRRSRRRNGDIRGHAAEGTLAADDLCRGKRAVSYLPDASRFIPNLFTYNSLWPKVPEQMQGQPRDWLTIDPKGRNLACSLLILNGHCIRIANLVSRPSDLNRLVLPHFKARCT